MSFSISTSVYRLNCCCVCCDTGELYYTTFCVSPRCCSGRDNSAHVEAGGAGVLRTAPLDVDDLIPETAAAAAASSTRIRYRCPFHWPWSSVTWYGRCAASVDASAAEPGGATEEYALQVNGSPRPSHGGSEDDVNSCLTIPRQSCVM